MSTLNRRLFMLSSLFNAGLAILGCKREEPLQLGKGVFPGRTIVLDRAPEEMSYVPVERVHRGSPPVVSDQAIAAAQRRSFDNGSLPGHTIVIGSD